MERIKVRNHVVKLEHYLIAGQTESGIAWKNGATVLARPKIAGIITPVGVPILKRKTGISGELVFGADAGIPAGEDIALRSKFIANNLAEEEALLLTYGVQVCDVTGLSMRRERCCCAVSDESKESGICPSMELKSTPANATPPVP
jgi:hypothetical protein